MPAVVSIDSNSTGARTAPDLFRFTGRDLVRCDQCGWVIEMDGDPCGLSTRAPDDDLLSIGTRVIARPGRGVNLPDRWVPGEIGGYEGAIYQVQTPYGDFWCEEDDVFPESPSREEQLQEGARVWALWQDGRFYPGVIDRLQGALRHIQFHDGDQMWVETWHCAILAREAPRPEPGLIALALHRSGRMLPAIIREKQGERFRVQFPQLDEETHVSREGLVVYPPVPFT